MQLCLAYRNEGGRVIVVLSHVPKTEMEEMFRYIIPDRQRYGSTFVFRQGNPLLPDALRMVAASSASATVIVTDTSRCVLGSLQPCRNPPQIPKAQLAQQTPAAGDVVHGHGFNAAVPVAETAAGALFMHLFECCHT